MQQQQQQQQLNVVGFPLKAGKWAGWRLASRQEAGVAPPHQQHQERAAELVPVAVLKDLRDQIERLPELEACRMEFPPASDKNSLHKSIGN